MKLQRISDLIKQLEEAKEQYGDLPIVHAHYVENEDFESPNAGWIDLAFKVKLEEDSYVRHYRDDGSFAYDYLLSSNPNWHHSMNRKENVLVIETEGHFYAEDEDQ